MPVDDDDHAYILLASVLVHDVSAHVVARVVRAIIALALAKVRRWLWRVTKMTPKSNNR